MMEMVMNGVSTRTVAAITEEMGISAAVRREKGGD